MFYSSKPVWEALSGRVTEMDSAMATGLAAAMESAAVTPPMRGTPASTASAATSTK